MNATQKATEIDMRIHPREVPRSHEIDSGASQHSMGYARITHGSGEFAIVFLRAYCTPEIMHAWGEALRNMGQGLIEHAEAEGYNSEVQLAEAPGIAPESQDAAAEGSEPEGIVERSTILQRVVTRQFCEEAERSGREDDKGGTFAICGTCVWQRVKGIALSCQCHYRTIEGCRESDGYTPHKTIPHDASPTEQDTEHAEQGAAKQGGEA